MFDNNIDHKNKAYQDQYEWNLNDRLNRLNLNDFVDKFDNDIHLIQSYVLDLYVRKFDMVWKIHHHILNIVDRFYQMDLYN